MRLNFQQLESQSKIYSISDFWVKESMFGVHWHYHPEIEICYVKQGSGHRIIGNSVERFEANDLVLVGSNLPHCWISDDDFNESELDMQVYVIHFKQELFPSNINELQHLNTFLNRARHGIKFNITKHTQLLNLLQDIEIKNSLDKYLGLCSLLNAMTKHADIQILATSSYIPEQSKKIENRIGRVCKYIQENYKNGITLKELADIASMNPAAFSRFFKKNIGKSPINYLNEVRINMACTKLLNSKDPAYEIAIDTGFNSITHFNKLFKRYKGLSPLDYRNSNGEMFML